MQEVHLMIRRKNSTIFLNVDDNILVLELEKIIEGILKVPHQEQQLYYKNEIMDENKTLADSNVKSTDVSKPATIGLTLRMENGDFEPLDIYPYNCDEEISEKSDDE